MNKKHVILLVTVVLLLATGGYFLLNNLIDDLTDRDTGAVKVEESDNSTERYFEEKNTIDINMIRILEKLQVVDIYIRKGNSEEAKSLLNDLSTEILQGRLKEFSVLNVVVEKMEDLHDSLDLNFNKDEYIDLVSYSITSNEENIEDTELIEGYRFLLSDAMSGSYQVERVSEHINLASSSTKLARAILNVFKEFAAEDNDFNDVEKELLLKALAIKSTDSDIKSLKIDTLRLYLNSILHHPADVDSALSVYFDTPSDLKVTLVEAEMAKAWINKIHISGKEDKDLYFMFIENSWRKVMNKKDLSEEDIDSLITLASIYSHAIFSYKRDGEAGLRVLQETKQKLGGGFYLNDYFIDKMSHDYFRIRPLFKSLDNYKRYVDFVIESNFKFLDERIIKTNLHTLRFINKVILEKEALGANFPLTSKEKHILFNKHMSALADVSSAEYYIERLIHVFRYVKLHIYPDKSYESFFELIGSYITALDFKEYHVDYIVEASLYLQPTHHNPKKQKEQRFEFKMYLYILENLKRDVAEKESVKDAIKFLEDGISKFKGKEK